MRSASADFRHQGTEPLIPGLDVDGDDSFDIVR
jgi:hypothetical protein